MDFLIDYDDLIDCYLLFNKSITIPQNIKTVCTGVFYGMDIIESIDMTDNVIIIEEMVFQGCRRLKKITLSKNLNRIGNYGFAQCINLEEITIPEGVNTIEIATFEDCNKLSKITLPKKLIRISDRAFYHCINLTHISIPETVTYIGNNSFHHCVQLKEFNIPCKVEIINEGTFSECHQLEKVSILGNVKEIKKAAFFNCVMLDNVKLPYSVTKIGSFSFANCYALTNIDIPSSVKVIEEGTFSDCHSLKNISLHEGLEKIEPLAFFCCKQLTQIKIPNSVTQIGDKAFSSCFKLEEITIPSSVTQVGENIFDNCPRLKKVTVGNLNALKNHSLDYNIDFLPHVYINTKTNETIFSASILPEKEEYQKLDMNLINELINTYNYSKLEAIMLTIKLQKESYDDFIHIKNILPEILEYYNLESKDYTIIYNHDHLNSLLKRLKKLNPALEDKKEILDITKFALSLGILDNNKITRQKASEFIATSIQKKDLKINQIHDIFEQFTPQLHDKGINKDWAEFIMYDDNFKHLINLEKANEGFINYIYEHFSYIKNFGRRDKGKQEYRKVTLTMCQDYYKQIYFMGTTEDTLSLANELTKYSETKKQKYFDEAIHIKNEYLELKSKGLVKEHILDNPLIENDIFTQIEEERENLISRITDIHKSLDEIANKKFTYELLSKEDPRNFTLGKYCSCCAHIAAVGYGIMRASIVHPTCQNLVIKDTRGEIVAKTTIYVNVEQGYAVCNTISVTESIKERSALEMIYKKFLSAIDDFANQYNIENPNNTIQQINVGADYNSLISIFQREGVEAEQILEGLHFSQYGKVGQNHNDDWLTSQYVIWENKKKGSKKNGKR